MKRKCKDCKLCINDICQIFKTNVSEEEGCPNFVNETYTCDFCGREFNPKIAVIDGDKIYCQDCGHALGTCATCRLGNVCEFQTNPGGPSPTIQKTVRQGNMQTIMSVPNPERTEFFCVRNNCPCYDQNLGLCLKNCQSCAKWAIAESHK